MRIRVGIFDKSSHASGISRYVQALLDALDGDEFEAALFAPAAGPFRPPANGRWVDLSSVHAPLNTPDNAAATETLSSPAPRWRRLVGAGWRSCSPKPLKLWVGCARHSLKLTSLFRRWPVDVLHLQVVNFEEAALAAVRAQVPRVLGTLHIDATRSQPAHWPLEALTHRCLDRAIAVSESTRRSWIRRLRLDPSRIETIHNGIDVDRFRRTHGHAEAKRRLGIAPESLVVGTIGRLCEQKGIVHLLRAAPRLANEHPRLVVAIAGDGPLRGELEQEAAALGLGGRVQFLGFRSDVAAVVEAFDVFALPSLWEALPFSVLEAMAMETPVVASDVAGVHEMVVDGRTGWLTPPADDAALADRIGRLLNDPSARLRMGRAGRVRVLEHFDERTMVTRTIDLYRQLAGQVLSSGAARGGRRRPDTVEPINSTLVSTVERT